MFNATIKIFAALVTVFASSLTLAEVLCDDGGNQMQLEACFNDRMQVAEKNLNAAYSHYVNTLALPEDIKKLRASQRIWLKFREMDCTAVVPPDERRGVGFLEWAGCVENRTLDRAKELEDMANCIQNGCFPLRKPFLE
jgi:uncharacterized protein YecT (DUF1311 family)